MTEFTSRPLNPHVTSSVETSAATTPSLLASAMALCTRFLELQTDALLAMRASNERFLVGVLVLVSLAGLSFWLFRRLRLL